MIAAFYILRLWRNKVSDRPGIRKPPVQLIRDPLNCRKPNVPAGGFKQRGNAQWGAAMHRLIPRSHFTRSCWADNRTGTHLVAKPSDVTSAR
ncbi:hypothetical protein TNCV_2839931 [Trichonephila clavipes]|uniref:Uncharacterized protein n=1 Tax=Trichonephila clavipes TaxID=2585209 RepID=A0A8X6RM61_TRICX|nr:hypothetical protein TNCV_2839931 [Trichonephila clavipes]